MRVSDNLRFAQINDHIYKAKSENMDALEKLSSQKKVSHLHDDPIGVTKILKHRSHLLGLENFQKNITFSRGFLDTTETAISNIQEKLGRAHELSIGMATQTAGPEMKKITEKEIAEIGDELVQLANSKFNDRYVFSGFRSRSPALAQDGTYLGDDGEIYLQIEDDHFKKINLSGREFFDLSMEDKKLGFKSMIETIQTLRNGLKNDDRSLIFNSIKNLEFHLDRTSSYQATVGAISTTLDQTEKRIEEEKVRETSTMSNLEDADMFKVSADFKRTEAILQSTLVASNKMMQPSLFTIMN